MRRSKNAEDNGGYQSGYQSPGASNRYLTRPSIARMTLDLDNGNDSMGMFTGQNSRGSIAPSGRTVEALQTRLQDLLVFEINQEGDSRMMTLSVRSLYKYVMGAIKQSAERRKPIRSMSQEEIKMLKTSFDEVKGDQDSSSGSDDDDEADQDAGHNLTAEDSQQARKSSSNKEVSFGGPQGPFVTEHPPKIPGVPIADEEEYRKSKAAKDHHRSSMSLPSTLANKEVIEQQKEKQVESAFHSGPVTYRERLGGYLHPRDMRRLVTPFSASNEPELIVRRHVMLLNFDPLRAVVLRDRLLVLVPDGADSLLQDLEKKVRGGTRELERRFFGESANMPAQSQIESIGDSLHSTSAASVLTDSDIKQSEHSTSSRPKKHLLTTALLKKGAKNFFDHPQHGDSKSNAPVVPLEAKDSESETADTADASEFREWEEMESRSWIELPFELQCLDAVLASVCQILAKDAYELKTNAIEAMDKLLGKSSTNKGDEILRHLKNSIKEMESRVKGFIRAMNLTLDESEDMALMNSSRLLTHPERFIQPVPEEILDEESDEPELILEAHLQQAFSLTNSLDLIRGEIDSTQELINQRLDAVRNRLLLANMLISVGSFCVALGSFIGSLFGMNVPVPMEGDPDAFFQIVLSTVLGMVSIVIIVGFILWYAGNL